MLGIRHLAGPIRDVGSADRRESVAGARCRCGFRDAWLLSLCKIQVWRGTVPTKGSAESPTSVRDVSARDSQVSVLSHKVVFPFFLFEDYLIYLVGDSALGVFSERLTVSCRANLRLGSSGARLKSILTCSIP